MNFCVGEDSCISQTTQEGSSYSLEPVCATDQALKQCHQQQVEKCNRLSNGPCPRAIKSVKSREKMYQALQQHAESLGTRLRASVRSGATDRGQSFTVSLSQ